MSGLTRLSASLRMAGANSAGPSTRTASAIASSRLSTITRHLSASSSVVSDKATKGSDSAAYSSVSSKMSSPSDALVLFESHQDTRLYKLNRSSKLNSLNQEMIDLLSSKLKKWRELDSCKVVIGTGDSRAFCAGGDVKQLVLDLKEGKDTTLPFFKSEFQLNWALGRLGKPYIAVIDGVTMGGGAGLSLPAPIRIATPRTIFAMPETKIGYAPDVGANYYLAQLDGAIGAWLAITGQELYGRAVYDLGIATHYVTPNLLPEIIHQITQLENPTLPQISTLISSFTAAPTNVSEPNSKSSPEGLSVIKGDIRKFLDKTFSLKSINEIVVALKNAAENQELSEEVRSWAKEQRDLIAQRSPTSTAVALAGYQKAKQSRRLDRTLLNDISMAASFGGPKRSTDDFIKGVSAVLIDRSKGPVDWMPSTFTSNSLTPKEIERYFFTASSSSDRGVPELELEPSSASKLDSGRDSTWGKFRKYGLPSEDHVKASVDGYAPGSGAFALTEKELIEQFVDSSSEASGTRRDEIVARVKDTVERYCKKDKDGYLEWAA